MHCAIAMCIPLPNVLVCKLNSTLNSFRPAYWAFYIDADMKSIPYTSFWGTLSREDYRIVDESIAMIGIEHLSGRMVHTLSDGERQKVMIAKALAQQTPIIILDEPTAFLDFPSKVEIIQLLHKLTREAGKTIFLSTHDMELALQIADKIWIMEKKKGCAIGTAEELAQNGVLKPFFNRSGDDFNYEKGLLKMMELKRLSDAADNLLRI